MLAFSRSGSPVCLHLPPGESIAFLGALWYTQTKYPYHKEETHMKAVVTRVKNARVEIDGAVNGAIDQGLLVLLGVGPDDTQATADKMADKVCGLRIFEDEAGKMNRNLETVGGSLLVVSQFTLYADLKSRRPGFTGAAKPETAVPLYEQFLEECRKLGFQVEHGEFGADMLVTSENEGPVTIIFDTEA